MTNDFITNFMVFWAIWILIPVMLDGTIALNHITFSWRMYWKLKRQRACEQEQVPVEGLPPVYQPKVSVVIPVHNSQDTLYNCLVSLAGQSYPLSRIEVMLVDNGSTDDSFNMFNQFLTKFPNMPVHWVRIPQTGKAKALNTGIFLGSSDILINLDSDTVLDKDVISEAVKALSNDEGISGATGAILIDSRQIEQNSWYLNLLQCCELFEYMEAFYIGRKYQAYHNTLFTLAGAFSCFNRQFLLKTFLYDSNSIAEDTKLTFELRRKNENKRVTFLENAKIFVEPISSMAKLYSQRVRWQRGELDVISSYMEYYQGSLFKLFKSFAARLLFIDHTMIFPRVVWTVLTPFLIFMGYPLQLIFFANLFVYFIYLFIDINYLLVSSLYVGKEYRDFLFSNGWKIIFLPLYRFVVFWFRAAGAIHAVTETAQWNVRNPVEETFVSLYKTKHAIWQWFKRSILARVTKERDSI